MPTVRFDLRFGGGFASRSARYLARSTQTGRTLADTANLRGVHGNDFDQIFVAFRMDGAVVAAVVAYQADLVAQPFVQRGWVAVLRVFGGKQFEQLEIIGQAAPVVPA